VLHAAKWWLKSALNVFQGRQSGEELKEVNKEDRKYSERFERWVNEGDMHFV